MSIANLRSEWLFSSRILRLSPVQRWSFVAALMWTHGEGSDGYVSHDDLDLIPGFDRAHVPALLEQRLLTETVGGWFVSPDGEPFEKSQTTRAQLEQHRAKLRDRVAKHRANRAGDAVRNGVTNDVTNEVSNSVGKQNKTKPNVLDVTTTARARGTRLNDGYMPPREVIDKMKAECPGVDFRTAHRKFMDYWLAKSGRDATKVDWDRTWCNWIRNELQNRNGGSPLRGADKKAMDWEQYKEPDQPTQGELE